jgi:hypothetical protein
LSLSTKQRTPSTMPQTSFCPSVFKDVRWCLQGHTGYSRGEVYELPPRWSDVTDRASRLKLAFLEAVCRASSQLTPIRKLKTRFMQ